MHVLRPVALAGIALLAVGHAPAQAGPSPRTLPSVVLEIPQTLSQPAIARGTLQRDRPNRVNVGVQGDVFTSAAAPDLVLRVQQDVEFLQLALLGPAGELKIVDARAYLESGATSGSGGVAGRFGAGDWAVWLRVPEGAQGTWAVAAWFKGTTALDPLARVGEPAADAAPTQRALSHHAPYFAAFVCGAPTVAGADAARQLFASLPASFFVFATQRITDTNGRLAQPAPGEPLLVAQDEGASAIVLTHDGVCFRAEARHLTAARPAAVALPPDRALKIVPSAQQHDRWADEDFLAILDPAVASAYRDKKKPYRACADRAWERLDPDFNASKFAVATRAGGKVTKIEDLTTKLGRQVDATCKLKVLWAERDRLEREALAALDKRRAQWRAATEAHLREAGVAK